MNTPLHGAAQPNGHRGRPALAAGLLAVLSSSAVVAQPAPGAPSTPAAVLLPPRPAPAAEMVWPRYEGTVRASGAELNAVSPYNGLPPTGTDGTARTERAPDPARRDLASPQPGASDTGPDAGSAGRNYPPTFSSGRRSGLIDFAPGRLRPAPAVAGPEPPVGAPRADHRPLTPPPSFTSPNIPADHTLVAPPAWRWYGYGAMHPAMNPLSPTGRLPAATANWLTQSGATPGAFPQTPHLPPPPEIPTNVEASPYSRRPFMQSSEPPLSGPAAGPAASQPINVQTLKPAMTGASLGSPLPPTGIPLPPGGGPSPELVLPGAMTPVPPGGVTPGSRPGATLAQPQSYNSRGVPVGLGPVTRGQAPEQPSPRLAMRSASRQLCERIRSAAGPSAHALRVEQHGDNVLKVKLTVARQADAEPVVNRIADVPELASYRVDFEVSSK